MTDTTALARADMALAENIARALAGHPDYRVLRRLRTMVRPVPPGVETFIGVIIDTETTGLEADCKIIELGLTRFTFDAKGAIYGIERPHTWFEDPGEPLTDDIKRITGITDEMVAGQKIADDEVEGLTATAKIIIAHNAKFDRPLVEKRLPFLAKFCWACSMEEIDWRAFHSPSNSLEAIAWSQGYFFEAHRAGDDTEATAALLALDIPLVRGGVETPTFLGVLLASARTITYRVWAADSSFDKKDALKARGYKWHDGAKGRPKCWYRDIHGEGAANAELEHLRTQKLSAYPDCTAFTCKDRYTERTLR